MPLRPATSRPRVGATLDYVAITASVNITSTNEAAPDTIITGSSVVYDGVTVVIVECYFQHLRFQPSAIPNGVWLDLLEDGTNIGRLVNLTNPSTTQTLRFAPHGMLRRTPAAGAHVYTVVGWLTGAGSLGAVSAGTGAANANVPGFLRIYRAN